MVCELTSDSRLCVLVFLQSSNNNEFMNDTSSIMSFFLEPVSTHLNKPLLSGSLCLLMRKNIQHSNCCFEGRRKDEVPTHSFSESSAEFSLHALWTAYRLSDPALNYFSICTDVLWEWGLWYLNGPWISFIFMASWLFSKQGNSLLCKIFSVDSKCWNH